MTSAAAPRAVAVILAVLGFALAVGLSAAAHTTAEQVTAILEPEIQPAAVTAFQLTAYLRSRIPALRVPSTARDWTAQSAALRREILHDVVLHGWPREWIEAPPRFEDLGVVASGDGYRLRKLRYEIIPGFQATAIACEPTHGVGKVPAVLNVSGHDIKGKATAPTLTRCITFARMGVLALSPEWPGFGELAGIGNAHDFGAHLELAGANAAGFFYLAMRRALDCLAMLPQVDTTRLGMTGGSGGGWQTIVLSSLDERVAVAVEVAGFGSLETNITHPGDTDETEENAADFARGQDYAHLVAMRAPRPTLLIHNAADECCFRAALVKPYIFDRITPFFALYAKEQHLAWHENVDPGTHNYGLDNRLAAYRFFAQHFGLPTVDREASSGANIGSADAFTVGVPSDNLTILGLARRLAQQIRREPVPAAPDVREAWKSAERARLVSVVRYTRADVTHAWRLWNTKRGRLESVSYRFDFANGLSATAMWLKAIATPSDAAVTIVLHDNGRKRAGERVADRIDRGEQVLAVDLLFHGEMVPQLPDPAADTELAAPALGRPTREPAGFAMLLSTVGDRPLGLEAGELLAVARWARTLSASGEVRLDTTGIRSQVVALTAAALEPTAFATVVSEDTMPSLRHLLDAPVGFRAAPELFCFDLYGQFDLDRLVTLAEPTAIRTPPPRGPAHGDGPIVRSP